MKNFKFILVLVIGLLFFGSKAVKATHYMGGEITWECIPAGQPDAGKFIFTVKLYRECYTTNGGSAANFGNSISLSSNGPVSSIPLTRLTGWPKDISPVCNNDTSFAHISCVGMPNGTANMGAVQEYVYKSQPIQLIGVPPATGWKFSYSSCCRNPSTNIINGQQKYYYLRAIMYPFANTNTFPCFDNSPTFAEPPFTVLCSGYPLTYSNNSAYDIEYDSLVYEWGEPLESVNGPLTFNQGYTYVNPFPDTIQNALNTPASINIHTGDINMTCFTTGAFVSDSKVTAYKYGIKVAEIWRDMQIIITDCGINEPPELTPPFNNGTSFIDTVYAGKLVDFNLSAFDINFLTNGNPQSINFRIFSDELGSFIPPTATAPPTFSATQGCLLPPCVTLTPAPDISFPLTAVLGISTNFSWQTTSSHSNANICGGVLNNVYKFRVVLMDDYCPIPASNSFWFTIVVLPKPDPMKVKINCISVEPTNYDISIDYSLVEDTLYSFKSYKIYCSDSLNGAYTLIDSINNINLTNYTYLGSFAPKSYYYIATTSMYLVDSMDYTVISDTVRIVNIDAIYSSGKAYLSWNSVNTYPSSLSKSYIYRRLSNNPQWLLLDSTNSLNYIDSLGYVSGNWLYMIGYTDVANLLNCPSMSNVVNINTIGITDNNNNIFSLEQNIPNPFNKITTIRFVSTKNQKFTFSVYDVNGRIISTKKINANKGNNEILFSREGLSSGIYIYELSDGVNSVSKRFVVSE